MTQIAELTITLDDVAPKVTRRVAVPLDLLLSRLHLVIQAAMGWENDHLYEFSWKSRGWVKEDADPAEGRLAAGKTTLAGLLAGITGKSFGYTYDFGDGWEHTIKVGKITNAEPGAVYPILLDATNACPPEDCGGPPGYEWLLSVLADPTHEEYDALSDWAGQIDPTDAQMAERQASVAAIARKWAKKTGKTTAPKPA